MSLVLVRLRFVDLAALPVILALGATLGACAGSATPGSSGGAGGSGGGPNTADGAADVGGTAGAAGVTASATGGTTNAVHTEVPGPNGPPGIYLTSESAKGSSGACATTTLGDVLAAIRVADPTLADIGTIYNPATATSDGSFIYAYDVGGPGFDVVFKRGLGDCAAGCTENDYQYYATDSSCRPVHVGHYHATWGTGTCLTVDGAPLWTHPMPPDPVTVCGQDNAARDLRGTYGLRGMGQRTPCSANAAKTSTADVTMKVVITQDPPDLATGTVTFWYTGDALVDGAPMPATFTRSRFTATRMGSNVPNLCPSQATVTAHYDFEGYQPGGLEAVDFGDAACVACKGSLSLGLSLAGDVNIP